MALSVSQPPKLGLVPDTAGSAQLSAITVPGLAYLVQSTTNLSNPAGWLPLTTTNFVPGNGVVLFTNSTTLPAQFFRLVFP